jgi:type I restriction enzyme S subunit
MNAERLLAHYERIAEAPDAIARLRRFILDLAVRGKLVPQDANDEPASELLKRIAKEKVRLMKAGEIRTPKAIPALAETPFPIPSNWRWSQLAEIGILSPRNEAPDTLEASFVPMPLIAAEYGVANQHEIRPWGDIKKGYTHFAEGDVGLAKITPCFENGKSAVFRNLTGGIGAGTTELHIVRPLFVDQDFILLFLKSPHFVETGIPKMTGTAGQKRVPTEYFAHSPFPLPPLAEQHRIVAKVDELMGLCDRLEAARAGREAVRDQLAMASLARLNAPGPETFQTDARFALDALPALTTRPEQIKQLRQTILNLAVRGKLVPQDPNDEPIAIGKRQTSFGNNEAPFEAPRGWRWFEFGDVAKFENGDRGKNYPNRDEYVEKGVAWINTGHIQSDGSLSLASMNYITRAKFEALGGGKIKSGDLLYCLRGATFGKTAFVEPFTEEAIASSLMIVRPSDALNRRFTYFYLISPMGRSQLLRFDNGTAQPNLSSGNVKKYLISVPPLAEQHRIVAKVDELMALCDRLEASLTATAATRRRLLDALLAEALAPADARKLEAAE